MTDIALRPAAPEDEPFLRRVYASTRAEELAPVPWPDEVKQAFCDMQFDAQDADYRSRWTDMAYDVVLVGGEPAGRFWRTFTETDVHVLDIAILPEFRGRGVGTMLMESAIELARTTGRTATISVERFNPARRLYERLGFVVTERGEVYDRMRWSPPDDA